MSRHALVLAAALAGCAAPQPQASFWDLTRESVPTDEQARQEHCFGLNREIARQNSLFAIAANSPYALAYQTKVRDNIAALESRRQQVQCDVQRVEVVEKSAQKTDLETCFAKCRELTNRSDEQCFDSCK